MKLFGREIIFNNLKKASDVKKNVELGATGTTMFGGFISDEDYVIELTGTEAITTYDQMRKSDGVVKAALLACQLPIRAANWYIEPVSEDKQDQEVADFVSENLFNQMTITWDDFLRQALLMLPFGFMVFEKVFTSIDFQNKQMIGWRKFAPRLPGTIFKWQTEDGGDGITQIVVGKTASIPIEKLLIFTHNKEGDNWTGISILRSAYRPWFFKEHIEKINAMVFERQGLGIPYAVLPQNASDGDKAIAKNLLKNIRANEQEYLLQPEGWEIEFKDMKAKTLRDPDSSIKRYNREILISVLAQFLDLGSGSTGSRALSVDQSSTFHNNLTATARQIKDIMNKYAIKQLVDLNYTVEKYPTLEFSRIGTIDFDKISKAVQGLTQVGAIVPDEKLEDYLREIMDLPEKPEEEETGKVKETPKEKELKPKKKIASEFRYWRQLTFAEKKVNFIDIEKKLNEAENKLKKLLKTILDKTGGELIRQMQIVMETPSSTERRERLKKMSVKYQGEYHKVILDTLKEIFEYGKTMAAHEMKKTPSASPASSLQNMSKQADVLTGVMANDLMKAGKLALLLGLQQNKSMTETLGKISKAIKREINNTAFNTSAISVGGALNQGRRASFIEYDNDIYALQRSEILDDVTCNYCLSVDGRVFKKNDPFTKNDGFHSSCRGIWVEIMKEETEKPLIEGIPESIRKGFDTINVLKLPRSPIIKKDSLAAQYLRSTGRL